MRIQFEELLLESDRLKLQLEQKKTQLALVEEKKAENELKMKQQIRSLLEAYLSLKNKVDDQNENCDENQQQLQMQMQSQSYEGQMQQL